MADGLEVIFSGGMAGTTTGDSGGTQYVFGTASSTTLESGSEVVYSGGIRST